VDDGEPLSIAAQTINRTRRSASLQVMLDPVIKSQDDKPRVTG